MTEDKAIAIVSTLASRQVDQEGIVSGLEEDLKDAKADLRRTSDKDLPEAMFEAGLSKFETPEGFGVSVSDVMNVSLASDSERRRKVIEWLRETGNGSIVVNELRVRFDKGRDDLVAGVVAAAKAAGLDAERVESVNVGTFKALIRDLMDEGVDVPIDEFGVRVVNRAKIKRT